MGSKKRTHKIHPFSPPISDGTMYVHPTPSLSAYLQGLVKGRPDDHIIWMWPEGIELQVALKNLHDGKCWCGRPPVPRVQWIDGGWECSRAHRHVWWQQFEFWHDVRIKVLDRDGWECVMCGTLLGRGAQVDHITPVTDGGSMWDMDNMQSLCTECHIVKTADDLSRRTAKQRRSRPADVLPLEYYSDK